MPVPGELIENRTFDEIEVGESAVLERTLSWRDIELFAVMSGDVNPAHVDEDYARSDMFHGIVAHGMWGASLISTLLGTRLPGPGTIYLEQTLGFRHPVTIGDTITVSVAVASKDPDASSRGARLPVRQPARRDGDRRDRHGARADGEGSAAPFRAARGLASRARRGFGSSGLRAPALRSSPHGRCGRRRMRTATPIAKTERMSHATLRSSVGSR